MRGVGVVLVLFHPDADALAHVEQARAQVKHMVVVDNTPEPDSALHDRLHDRGIVVVANRNEGGLGHAYNVGVRRLIDDGCELAFLFDQDSEIDEDYIKRMVEASVPLAGGAYLLGPRIFEVRAGIYMPDGADPTDHTDGLHATEQLISSGSAVSAAAYEQIGPFNDDLFIEWIDVEYSLRAARAGVPRYVNPGVVLRQFQGAITRHGPFLITNHRAVRRYYLIRNGIWTEWRYGRRSATVKGVIVFIARELTVIVCFERDKLRKIVGVLAGAFDGLRGRLGDLRSVHPRLFSALRG